MSTRRRQPGDELLLSALAAGGPIEQAAQAAGVSVRTVYRRLADPGFRSRLGAARDELIVSAIGALATIAAEAITTLHSLLSCEEARVRLGAAKAILDHTLRLREALLLEQRVASLERQRVGRKGSR